MINRNYLDIISHRKKGKASFTRLCALLTLLCFIPFQCVYGLPSGEQVESGTVSFERSDTSLKITASDNAIINFNSFNIGLGETVTFLQPETTSKVLNRISGPGASVIEGSLLSNGIVFLVNPSGLHFASTATVNVGSLVASTLNIESRDFLQGNYIFSNTATPGTIINEGTLTANQGGSIAMLSHHIENSGLIQAHLGKIVIASSDALTLSFDSQGLLCFVIDTPTQKALEGIDTAIANSGTLDAQGGNVYIEAQAVKDVFKASINNSGIIKANSVKEHNGKITLVATGTTTNSGFIDASSQEAGVNAGDVSIHADTLIQQGSIKANASDNAKAGSIELLGKTKSTYTNGALIEAKGKDTLSEGGKVYINTTEGDTDYQKGALIDVSGGTVSGDAGSIEISAKQQLGYQGKVRGVAQAGYKGGSVFFDPYDITIQTGGYDTVFGGDDTSMYPIDESYSEHSGETLTFDPSANGSFYGFQSIQLQATHDININSNFNTTTASGMGNVALSLEADNNININANIVTDNASIVIQAKNNLTQAAGTVIDAGAGDVGLYADFDTNGTGILNRDPSSSVINSGSFYLQSASDLATNTILTAGDNTTGRLSMAATNDHNILINSNITRVDQGITLYANGNITQSAGTTLTAGTGDIGLFADNDINGVGVLTRDPTARAINSGGLFIQSASDLATNTLFTATDAATGYLSVKTTQDHNITINTNQTRVDHSIVFDSRGNLTQAAGTTINAGTGDIELYADYDTNGIGVLTRDPTARVINTGAFSLQSASDLATNTIITAGDNTTGLLFIHATGDHSLTINSNITRANKSVYMEADGNLIQGAGTTINAGVGYVGLNADEDNNGIGALTRDPSARVINSGGLNLSSASDLFTSQVLTAGDNSQWTLYLQTTHDHNITIDSDVSRTNIDINIFASGNLIQAAGTTVDAGQGGVALYADADNNGVGTLTRDPTSKVVSTNWGRFALQSASDLATNTILTAGDNTAGNLYLMTTADHTITINSNITRANKNINFTASGNVIQSAGTTINAGAGDVALIADYDANGVGTLSRDPSARVINSGAFNLQSGSDLVTNALFTATDAASGDMIITTTKDHSVTINSNLTRVGHNVIVYSNGNVTQAAGTTLDVGTGSIWLDADFDTNGVGTLSRDPTARCLTAGSLSLESGSDMNTGTIFTAGDNVAGYLNLTTTSDHNITIDSNITTIDQGITFYSNGSVIQNAGTVLNAGTGGISIYADLDNNGVGSLQQASGAIMLGGSIYITSSGVGSILNATASLGNDITVNAMGGTLTLGNLISGNNISIVNSGSAILDDGNIATKLQGNVVTISGSSIGTASASLNTQATTLSFCASNGDAFIRDAGNPTINPSSAHNGSVNLSTNLAPTITRMVGASGIGSNSVNLAVQNGDYTVNSTGNARGEEALGFSAETGNLVMAGNLTGNGFNLTSTTGNILDGNGAANNITAAGACTFAANGYIGTAADPLEVNINPGSLAVTTQGQLLGVSSAISGTVLPNNRYSYNTDAPGSVIFNGIDIKAIDIANAQAAARQAYIDSITLHEKGVSLYNMNNNNEETVQQQDTALINPAYIPNVVDFSSYTLPNPYNFHISPYLVLPGEARAGK